jgi:hypothetical protein
MASKKEEGLDLFNIALFMTCGLIGSRLVRKLLQKAGI